MAVPAFIVFLIVFLYTLTISCFALVLYGRKSRNSDPEQKTPGNRRKVSILIPFRNERKTLPYLISDLLQQNYPADRMEILCINDHSEDGSGILIESLDHTRRSLRWLDLPEGRQGKKEALAFGMEHASHSWIIQLDADCRIHPQFVSTHMDFLERKPSDLVAGLVTTDRREGGFLEHFERLDQLSLMGVSAASFQLGRAMMCSGANLAYSKELYNLTRSFDPSAQLASGDDMFLMIGARKLGKALSFNLGKYAVVHTNPAGDLKSFLKQRARWGTKSTHYKMLDIQLLALLVVLTHISVWLIPLWIVLFPMLWPYFLGTWILKSGVDFMLLYRTSHLAGQRKSLNYFLPSTLLYYPVYLLVFVRMIFKQSAWRAKGSV